MLNLSVFQKAITLQLVNGVEVCNRLEVCRGFLLSFFFSMLIDRLSNVL